MNRISDQSPLAFAKMHGLGNDFVIIDARKGGVVMTPALARAIGDRHRGVGFDQLAVIDTDPQVAARITFWNSDGTMAGACGNASRCLARLLMEETGTDRLALRTERGVLDCVAHGDLISVNMGLPELEWEAVPLAKEVDLNALPIDGAPGAAGMGNTHMVFHVADVGAVDLPRLGPELEHHPLYPERTNVEFCQVLSRDHIRMRVWERGGMITQACGSGACAAVVVLHRQGHIGPTARVTLDGGDLEIDWRADGVWMTGPTAKAFDGVLSPELLP